MIKTWKNLLVLFGLIFGSLLIFANDGLFALTGQLISSGKPAIYEIWLRDLGWIFVAAIGYTIGLGIAIIVFDLLSTTIEEWDEVKNKNTGVSIIIITLVVTTAILLFSIFSEYTQAIRGENIDIWEQYGTALGWGLISSIGFSLCVGLAIKIFDLLSTQIEEWEEIKKGNIGVSLIFAALILMSGIILAKNYSEVVKQSGAASVLTIYGKALLWGVVSTIGYVFSIGLAIKVFDVISTKIEEWEEIKKGNIGVAIIFISLIVMSGLIIFKLSV